MRENIVSHDVNFMKNLCDELDEVENLKIIAILPKKWITMINEIIKLLFSADGAVIVTFKSEFDYDESVADENLEK